eukprot:m.182653 g.182653  ORF g.182653 m.182653 type:complete len:424 (+) comp18465_c0_seq3:45-1316(+)
MFVRRADSMLCCMLSIKAVRRHLLQHGSHGVQNLLQFLVAVLVQRSLSSILFHPCQLCRQLFSRYFLLFRLRPQSLQPLFQLQQLLFRRIQLLLHLCFLIDGAGGSDAWWWRCTVGRWWCRRWCRWTSLGRWNLFLHERSREKPRRNTVVKGSLPPAVSVFLIYLHNVTLSKRDLCTFFRDEIVLCSCSTHHDGAGCRRSSNRRGCRRFWLCGKSWLVSRGRNGWLCFGGGRWRLFPGQCRLRLGCSRGWSLLEARLSPRKWRWRRSTGLGFASWYGWCTTAASRANLTQQVGTMTSPAPWHGRRSSSTPMHLLLRDVHRRPVVGCRRLRRCAPSRAVLNRCKQRPAPHSARGPTAAAGFVSGRQWGAVAARVPWLDAVGWWRWRASAVGQRQTHGFRCATTFGTRKLWRTASKQPSASCWFL